MAGPGRELALGDLEADVDIFAGVFAVGLDALDQLGQFELIPVDLLRQVRDDRHVTVGEARGAKILTRHRRAPAKHDRHI